MKKRAIQLGLAGLVLAFVGLFTAAPAMAANYTCQQGGNPPPANVTGDANISESGPCTLSTSVTATGSVRVSAGGAISTQALTSQSTGELLVNTTAGSIQTGALTSGSHVKVTTPSGTINVGNVSSNNGGNAGNVLITASGNVQTGSITTNGGSKTGSVEIDANTGGGNTLFTIGAATSNGVSGSINTSNTTGGGTAQDFIVGGVQITNGNANSTGGITVTSVGNLQVNASASRSGIIRLNAQKGTLTLPSGVLQTDGAAGQGAGYIQLIASTLAIANDTKLSASQDNTALGTGHGINIAANTISFGGATGLEVHADGKGAASNLQANAIIVPQAAMTFGSNQDYMTLLWSTNFPNGTFGTSGLLNFIGSAGSPLTITADGDHAVLAVSGYPINFTGGALTIHSRAAIDHSVFISFSGSLSGITGLTFGNTGAVSVDANGVGGAGGTLQIANVDKAQFNAPTHTISANGPTSGNGDGGTVLISSSALTLGATSKATITADAASAGTGNAIASPFNTSDPKAIQFFPGAANVTLGTANGQYKFSAKGGKNGGNGGAININPCCSSTVGKITVKNVASAVDASAQAGPGNGGLIQLAASASPFVTVTYNATPKVMLKAIGKGTGTGGIVVLNGADSSNAQQAVNTNANIQVDGGKNVAANAFDGSISINGTICQQWKTKAGGTVGTDLPRYWNCAHPDNQTADELLVPPAIAGLPQSFLTTLKGASLYVFSDSNGYNNFFATFGTTFQIPAGILGNTPSTGLDIAAVVESTGSGVDYGPYLRGNLMHEVAHRIDFDSATQPSGTVAFRNAETATIAAMTGTWPNPPSPTCQQVYGNTSPLCAQFPNSSPWAIFQSTFIGGQDQHLEMFADAFQNCSNYELFSVSENNAQQSIYMKDVWTYMNTTFWPGGCPRQE